MLTSRSSALFLRTSSLSSSSSSYFSPCFSRVAFSSLSVPPRVLPSAASAVSFIRPSAPLLAPADAAIVPAVRSASAAPARSAAKASLRAVDEKARKLVRAAREKAAAKRAKKAEAAVAKRARRAEARKRKQERAAAARARRSERLKARRDGIRERARAKKEQAEALRSAVRTVRSTLEAAAPRKPSSAFILFQKDFLRSSAATGLPSARVVAGAARWRALSDAEKAPYQERATALRADHVEEVAQFKAKFVQPNARPRRPLHGYLRFTQSRISTLRAQRPGLDMREYIRQAAAEWKLMSEKDKEQWRSQGAGDSARYKKELEEYRQRPQEQQLMGRLYRRTSIRRKRLKAAREKRAAKQG